MYAASIVSDSNAIIPPVAYSITRGIGGVWVKLTWKMKVKEGSVTVGVVTRGWNVRTS